MNLREGTRRLALLAGAVGAIAGGVLAYAQLQATMRQRADHQRFERLANSSVVKQARKDCFETNASSEHGPWEKYQTEQEYSIPFPKGAKIGGGKIVPPFCFIPIDDPNALGYTPSESNSGGIKTVHFERHKITSIETQDGETLYPTPAPGVGSYLLIAILPVLGFFVPWGAVRAIGWMLAGFVQPLN